MTALMFASPLFDFAIPSERGVVLVLPTRSRPDARLRALGGMCAGLHTCVDAISESPCRLRYISA